MQQLDDLTKPAASPSIRLFLMGTCKLTVDQQAAKVGTRKALALLAFLAVQQKAVHRSEVFSLLWPESGEREGRRSLRVELTRLGHQLGQVVQGQGDLIWLDSQKVGVDLWDFREHLKQGRFDQAWTLFGGPLLQGFHIYQSSLFEDWLEHARNQVQGVILEALSEQIDLAETQHAYLRALALARKAIELDGLCEAHYVRAIRLAYLAGDRAQALRLLQQSENTLKNELGLTPSPELQTWMQRVTKSTPAVATPLAMGNLPSPLTPLLGRDALLKQIVQYLKQERLVSLIGPGGVGKTRLAVAVGHAVKERFAHGVFWVALAPLQQPQQVLIAIANALGVQLAPQPELILTLVNQLKHQHLLLILDNFEHVLAAAPTLSHLLEQCPYLYILLSSRAALHLRGEKEVLVPSLTLPHPEQDPASYTSSAAVQLFLYTAGLVQPHLPQTPLALALVGQICARLDGLPLAIELAASRSKALSLQAIVQRLDDRLHLLVGGPKDLPERQQTLWNTLVWSHNLLSSSQQLLLAQLSVFAGGFDLNAAQAVATLNPTETLAGLAALIDSSLLQSHNEAANGLRYSMLQTVREFAQQQLMASPNPSVVFQRHYKFYAQMAEEASKHLRASQQHHWLSTLDQELNNLRVALAWAVQQSEGDWALQMAGALAPYWWLRGTYNEGFEWLNLALQKQGSLACRARAFAAYGSGGIYQGDLERARWGFAQGLELWQTLDNTREVANARGQMALIALREGDLDAATQQIEPALELARQLGDKHLIASNLHNLAVIALHQENYLKAKRLCEEALFLRREMNDAVGISKVLTNLGLAEKQLGNLAQAYVHYQESLNIACGLGAKHNIAIATNNLATLALDTHNFAKAEQLFRECSDLYQELNDLSGLAILADGWASLKAAQGEWVHSARLVGVSNALRQQSNSPRTPAGEATLEAYIAPTRQHLGSDWNRWVREGQFMSLKEALQRSV